MSSIPLFERLGGRPVLMRLLRHFYADVRQNHEIGPLFEEKVHDWPAHLEKIADFWSMATGGPTGYRGGMPMKHMELGLEERHFAAWLDLWERNCRAQLPAAEAEELVGVAHGIGARLRQIVGTQSRPSVWESSPRPRLA